MFSRSVLRSFTSDIRLTAPSSIASPFTQRACLHQTALLRSQQQPPQSSSTSSTSTPDSPLSAIPRAQSSIPDTQSQNTPQSQLRDDIPVEKQPLPPTFTSPVEVSKTLMEQLPHLAGQKPHYVVAELHARPFLLTEGDHVRLPFLMPKVKTGDILRFNRASAVGSRDFTLKGSPHVDERLFECRVRVVGVESEPLRIKEKTKRRQRHTKTAKSKHRYTIMRVMDVKVKSPEQLLKEGAVVVEDKGDSPQVETRS
ncbi:hypothetical protein N7478_001772 [Penicillium angulare]|uniref:uncharacterized protein n=1 Tax=Penicillium angulare TaxID=116970 RepID=UPI002541A836|nr:uncharacterized protein N7478_001772 [Penicillium angulare]KAJ5288742.1 hypothetical protein N7478_001772 [Penicillium angulare]